MDDDTTAVTDSMFDPWLDSESAIYQALGAASMCWNPRPEGEFDSQRAAEIGADLLAHLRRLRLVPDPVDDSARSERAS